MLKVLKQGQWFGDVGSSTAMATVTAFEHADLVYISPADFQTLLTNPAAAEQAAEQTHVASVQQLSFIDFELLPGAFGARVSLRRI